MAREQVDVAIVGAGVAGLALALAASRAGLRVRVWEQRTAARSGGALNLWANALDVLTALGLGPAFADVATPLHTAWISRQDGAVFQQLAFPPDAGRHHAVPRGDLLELLASALPDDPVRRGTAFAGFTEGKSGVEVVSEAGDRVHASVLVGADGVHSRVRQGLFGVEPARPVGQIAYLGRTPGPTAPEVGETHAVVGTTTRFWAVTTRDGDARWYAIRTEALDATRGPAEGPPDLLEDFASWPAWVTDLLERADAASFVRVPLYDRAPSTRWAHGRVALCGDAAHAMSPDLDDRGRSGDAVLTWWSERSRLRRSRTSEVTSHGQGSIHFGHGAAARHVGALAEE